MSMDEAADDLYRLIVELMERVEKLEHHHHNTGHGGTMGEPVCPTIS